jgi:hypothetical protein
LNARGEHFFDDGADGNSGARGSARAGVELGLMTGGRKSPAHFHGDLTVASRDDVYRARALDAPRELVAHADARRFAGMTAAARSASGCRRADTTRPGRPFFMTTGSPYVEAPPVSSAASA